MLADKETHGLAPGNPWLDDLRLIEAAARHSGDIAMKTFRADPRIWTKENESPVTEADLAIDRYLGETLRAARPDYGWLSEETEDDKSRLTRECVFIVDPIDGTKGYIKGGDDWTVSIAVARRGEPVAAALFRPVTGEMYCAVRDGGATRDGAKISASRHHELTGARVAGPSKMVRNPKLGHTGIQTMKYVHSLALRVAFVADGRVEGAAAKARASDWDLAAADLLVRESGGILSDLSGAPLDYNRPHSKLPAFLAAAPLVHAALLQVLAAAVPGA